MGLTPTSCRQGGTATSPGAAVGPQTWPVADRCSPGTKEATAKRADKLTRMFVHRGNPWAHAYTPGDTPMTEGHWVREVHLSMGGGVFTMDREGVSSCMQWGFQPHSYSPTPRQLRVSQGNRHSSPQTRSSSSPFFSRQLSLEATVPSEGGAWQWPM